MSETKDPQESEKLEQTTQEPTEKTTDNGAADEKVQDLEVLKTELESQKAKADEYYAQLQRLKAEFDNFRKRTQREKEEIAKYASERVIFSLLPVLDNLERAVESAQKNKDFDSLSQGVTMILKQFCKVLEDEGLRGIEAVGQEFDPNLHDALLREESEQGENIILEEIQKGYYLKDKILRASKVKVSG